MKYEVNKMKELELYIQEHGEAIGTEILKVDSFLNHQIDCAFMMDLAQDLKHHFSNYSIDKIATIETSGIAPSVFLGYLLQVPVVYFKKSTSKILKDELYQTKIHSFTKDIDYQISVAKKYLCKGDHVLLIDDFMANGEACLGAINLIEQAQAQVAGIGIVIEKAFQNGRAKVEALGYEVYAQARIKSLHDGIIEFVES